MSIASLVAKLSTAESTVGQRMVESTYTADLIDQTLGRLHMSISHDEMIDGSRVGDDVVVATSLSSYVETSIGCGRTSRNHNDAAV